ncbi:Ribokinase [Hondaea fermentalgiana]|uniref:Ribokinase n=1 Tax=Hondaea fermentalgiana TaxID=2315210 RepID=A0A2R5H0M0_9STRA|nr:Ribokinase [Hondaea fermentalgiana]|eukprot:GBG33864.1 Ribokinase [Hondaea fermentalgiana]
MSTSATATAANGLVVVGSLNMDSFRYVDALPEPGETVSATHFEEGVGGKGCNQASMAGLFARKTGGAVKVSMLGCVGSDAQGKELVRSLVDNGVDTKAILTREDGVRSGSAAITVDSKGENTIVVHPGANYAFGPKDLKALDGDLWTQAAVVLCQNEIPIEVTSEALKRATADGKLALWNFAPASRTKVSPSVFQACSVLIVNETEAKATLRVHLAVDDTNVSTSGDSQDNKDTASHLEDVAKSLASSLDDKVPIVLTAGSHGALVVSYKQATWVSSCQKVDKQSVVDTTGAGDCFAGVFAAETARQVAQVSANGLDHAILCKAATLACTAAGLSIRQSKALEAARSEAKELVAKAMAQLQEARDALADRDREAKTAKEALDALRAKHETLERKHEESVEQQREAAKARRQQEYHPIYGKLLHDFGYKKVFASEPKKLTNKSVVPVWEKQRIFRPERARQIAKAKKDDNRFGFPGVITMFDLDAPDKRGIVDGQHRIGGLELMLREGTWSDDNLVLTEVYPVGDDDQPVGDLFMEINQSQPVAEMDLPGVADEGVRDAITRAADKLAEDFAAMFKPSLRCRPPHLNIDNFRQELWESEKARKVVTDALDTKKNDPEAAQEALLAWLLDQNAKLQARSDAEWSESSLVRVKNQKTLVTALDKARKNEFFLGLDLSWQ